MQQILAIVRLTFQAAFRFRLLPLLCGLLLAAVVILPLVIQDDGTAEGFVQIILTYTLAAIMTLLGFATLWLACGTLAGDVADAQIQMVVVKPIARWQIWLGKWFGILLLDAILLAISTTAVFVLLQWRAGKLPPAEQAKLHSQIMVANGVIRFDLSDIEPDVDQELQQWLKAHPGDHPESDIAIVRNTLREEMRQELQIVPPGYVHVWPLELGVLKHFLKDKPMHVRSRFNVTEDLPGMTYLGSWIIGIEDSTKAFATRMSMAPQTSIDIEIPPNLYDEEGVLTIRFYNQSPAAMLFPLDNGMEVLYPESSFGINFFRGVFILFLWLAFLAALGLAASSYLSFPVAAFVAVAILIVGASSDTLNLAIYQGTVFTPNQNTGKADNPALIDYVAIPVFRLLLAVINLVKVFSPIEALSSGRSINWFQIGKAVLQIGVLMCGALSLIGIGFFNRRELAAEQSNH